MHGSTVLQWGSIAGLLYSLGIAGVVASPIPTSGGMTAYSHSAAGTYPLPWDLTPVEMGYWEQIQFTDPGFPPLPLQIQVDSTTPPPIRKGWGWQRPQSPSHSELLATTRQCVQKTVAATHRFEALQAPDPAALHWAVVIQQAGPLETDPQQQALWGACYAVTFHTYLANPQGEPLWTHPVRGQACGDNAPHRAIQVAIHQAVVYLLQHGASYSAYFPIQHVENTRIQWEARPHTVSLGQRLPVFYQPTPIPDPALEPVHPDRHPRYIGDVEVTVIKGNRIMAQTRSVAPGGLAPGDWVRMEIPWQPGQWASHWRAPPLLPPPFHP